MSSNEVELKASINTFFSYDEVSRTVREYDIHTGQPVGIAKELDVGRHQPYSLHLVAAVCEQVAQGESLTKVCKKQGMPSYRQFCVWRKMHPEVSQMLEDARRDRAEALRDMALEEALKTEDKDDAVVQRLKHDAYKWAAGVDDQRFSPRAKVEASINAPMQIVLHTGIDRSLLQVDSVDGGKNDEKIEDAKIGSGEESGAGDAGQGLLVHGAGESEEQWDVGDF